MECAVRVESVCPRRRAATLMLVLATVAGCGRREPDPLASVRPEPVATTAARTGPVTPPSERLLEPFDPPALETLDRDAKWIDRPVRDGLVMLRDELAKEPAPATAAEALAVENDSPAANARILSALGRLPGPG